MNETTKTESMTIPVQRKHIRLWPGITLAILLLIIKYILSIISPGFIVIGVFGGLIACLLIIVWWAFFSRTPFFDRLGALVLMILALLATSQIIDISIKTSMMGMMFAIYSFPLLCIAFVAWAALSRNLPIKTRRITMVATIILTTGFWALLRTDGMSAEAHHDLNWRWAKTFAHPIQR
jgi:hypothetical protein